MREYCDIFSRTLGQKERENTVICIVVEILDRKGVRDYCDLYSRTLGQKKSKRIL